MASEKQDMSIGKSLRHLVVFQLKLALDAVRDFAFSPMSIIAFVLDALLSPPYEQSLTYRLKKLGRRSDRVINLFDEFGDRGHYTVDETFKEVEKAMVAQQQGQPGEYKDEDR